MGCGKPVTPVRVAGRWLLWALSAWLGWATAVAAGVIYFLVEEKDRRVRGSLASLG